MEMTDACSSYESFRLAMGCDSSVGTLKSSVLTPCDQVWGPSVTVGNG